MERSLHQNVTLYLRSVKRRLGGATGCVASTDAICVGSHNVDQVALGDHDVATSGVLLYIRVRWERPLQKVGSPLQRDGEEHVAERSQVKQRILRAAAELFMERGFAGTTVREIGERAEVGQSSLYHHAHSKGQLLRELHDSFVEEQFELLEKVVASEESPTTQLRGLIRVIMSMVHTSRPVVTVYLRESYALSEEDREEVRHHRQKVYSMVDSVLTRGVESGEFRQDLDVHLTRLAILGMCNWSYQWYRPDGPQVMTDISEHFADIVVLGVLDSEAARSQKSVR
jgi:AcrR family transcriptional regulator